MKTRITANVGFAWKTISLPLSEDVLGKQVMGLFNLPPGRPPRQRGQVALRLFRSTPPGFLQEHSSPGHAFARPGLRGGLRILANSATRPPAQERISTEQEAISKIPPRRACCGGRARPARLPWSRPRRTSRREAHPWAYSTGCSRS